MRYLLGTLALGCAMASPAFAEDGPLVINAIQAPNTMDPAGQCNLTYHGYVAPLYAPLVAYGRTEIPGVHPDVKVTTEDSTNIVGVVAESWTVSDDGLTYTFNIRPGMKFASGNPMDAAAVGASLQRALDSGSCGTYFMHAANFDNEISVEVAGESVIIRMTEPMPLYLHSLTQTNVSIVDVKKIEENGGDEWFANNGASSGPYMLAEYQPGVRAVYKTNPNYFGEPPIEPEVVLNFVSDPSALLLQARNGDAHVTLDLPKSSLAQLADTMNIVGIPAPRWDIMGIPNELPPFDNRTFREALTYAVPYDVLIDAVADGYGETFFGPFPPIMSAYNAELGGPRSYDMDKAKALLAESGVALPIDVPLIISEEFPDHAKVATIIQGVWGQLGVNVEVSKLSPSAFEEQIDNPGKKALIISSEGPAITDPAWLLGYDLRCGSGFNTSDYCNPDADVLFDKALTMSPDDRQPFYDQIAEIWVNDAPRVPLYATKYTMALDKSVTIVDFAQDGPFDIWRWSR